MTEQKTCPNHHLSLVFHAEGISKGGNRFNAFYACPKGKKDCGYTENIEEKQGHFLSIQAEFRRAKEIAYGGAMNRAVELAKDITYKDRWDEVLKMFERGYKHFEEFYKKQIMEIEE